MKMQKEYGYQCILSLKFAIFSRKQPFSRTRGAAGAEPRGRSTSFGVYFFFVEVGGGGVLWGCGL